MSPLSVTVVLVLLVGAWAQLVQGNIHPACDSLVAEAAALVAQDYLNAQHKHGYKYTLNQIEDIKVFPKPNGEDIYILEVELLETDCHILDPTPVANCTVRPKVLTAVEGDCDVVLKRVGGALTVTAFKCKTEESREDICIGCPTLLALNDTAALDFVSASLTAYNDITDNVTFTLLEVGRMSTQIVSGGSIYLAEYVIVEADCTGGDCVPLADNMAQRGFCTARGLSKVNCKIFPSQMTSLVDANSTAPVPAKPPVNVHTSLLTAKHGLRHHKLTSIHDPELSGLLSEESAESSEVVPVAPAVIAPAVIAPAVIAPAVIAPAVIAAVEPAAVEPAAVEPDAVEPAAAEPAAAEPALTAIDSAATAKSMPVVKRQAPGPDATADIPAVKAEPISLAPRCPGKIKYFD